MDTIKLAIVDDHDLFLQGMSALLSSIEHVDVLTKAGNGREFLNQLSELVETPDVVLLDLKMPVMDGVETLKHLKKDYPSIKVVILSMHEDEQFVLNLIKIGVNGYLLKNSTISEVIKAIEEVHNNDYYYDKFITKIMHYGLTTKKKTAIRFNDNVHLTARELEVLDLICQQYTAKEIADKLFLSTRTVEGHRKSLLEKTYARNTAGLIVYCINKGIIKPEKY